MVIEKKKNIEKLSFGLMLPGETIQAWQAECIQLLTDAGHSCKLLIIDANEVPKKSFLQKLGGYLSSTGLYHFYQRFFFRPKSKFLNNIGSILKLDKESADLETISCKTTKKKYSEYFFEEDIQSIKSHQLDFILRFGFNIIRGDILDAAKHGIWSFHHDDEQKYRGGPPGFWEILKKDPVTGAILQRLTDKLDGGIILRKGFFKTIDHSYAGQIDQLYFGTAGWPLQVCNDMLNYDSSNLQQSKTTAAIFKAPGNFQMLRFWNRMLINKIRFYIQELFKPEEWNVGISETPLNKFTGNLKRHVLHWLPEPPKGRYYADPFGFMVGDDLHIVFEDYNYKTRKGKISQLVFSDGKFGDMKTVIEEDFHLSYPSIFQHEGEIFCVPESVEAGQVRLYKFEKESGNFRFMKLLLMDFPGVDPTVFRHQGKWWLFASHKEHSNTNLHIFYSNQFDGPYVPHANNPVKTDIRNSRPAGSPFIENDDLIRPAQDCSKTYGGRIALNKIVELTEITFFEETKKYISPLTKSDYPKGFHTLASAGNYTIFDGKRFRFNWNNFLYKLKMKMGRKME